jgi:hypothetical protein
MIAEMEANLLWGHKLSQQQSRTEAFTVVYVCPETFL